MELWITDNTTNARTPLSTERDPITIGRDDDNAVVLKSAFVARHHCRIVRRGNQLFAEALGQAGTRAAGREVVPGKPAKVDFGDEIQVGQYSLVLVARDKTGVAVTPGGRAKAQAQLHTRLMELEAQVHAELLERLNLRVTGQADKNDPRFAEEVLRHLGQIAAARVAAAPPELLRHAMSHHLLRLVLAEVVRQCEGRVQTDYKAADARLLDPLQEQAVTGLVASLVDMMPLLFDPTSVQEDLAAAEEAFPQILDQELPAVAPALQRYLVLRAIVKDVQDILFGLGPLTDLLEMPSVSEIMVVGKDRIYIEKNGRIEATSRTFFSDDILLSVVERILTPVGRRVDTSTPLVDARLPDGSRVNVVISPLSLVGPCLTIRKFGWVPFTMDDLVDRGSVSPQAAAFLRACIAGKRNILISGGTGSGKTTLLNILGGYADPAERIVTVEESAELRLPQPHVVRLEGRPANVEGKGAYSIRELVKNALRMRPDRIIVGEVRAAEALDMLQAMNTGHDGSLATIHSNTPSDCMKRLEALVMMAVDMPIRAIREQVVSAVHLVVQVGRMPDGRRRVTHISELTAIDPVTNEIRMEDIFVLRDPAQPRLRHTGYVPSFVEHLIEKKTLDVEVFL